MKSKDPNSMSIKELEALLKKKKDSKKKPIKPLEPEPPQKMVYVKEVIHRWDPDDDYSLADLIKMLPPGVKPENAIVSIKISQWYGNGGELAFSQEMPNIKFEEQRKRYEEKVLKFKEKLETYGKELKAWKEENK